MKKTNLSCVAKFTPSEWNADDRFIENTDENGVVEIFFKAFDGVIWNWPLYIFEALRTEILADHFSTETPAIIYKEEEKGVISENFALKMIAMIANKEKLGDL